MESFFGEQLPFTHIDSMAPSLGQKVVHLLMNGWSDTLWQNILSWEFLVAILWSRDAAFCASFKTAFQEGFDALYLHLKRQNIASEQAEVLISHAMSFFVFGDPNPDETIRIPQYIAGTWQQVTYTIVPIELTPTSGLSAIWLAQNDRVFAYGLEPRTNDRAEPYLIFMGTTYPAGQGFFTQLYNDMESFSTPGRHLHHTGRQNISHWLEQQPSKVRACGASLGGSLCLILGIDQGHRISRIDALNPPGLFECGWESHPWDHWVRCTDKPSVHIYRQARDWVSLYGVWKNEWYVWQLIPPTRLQGPYAFLDHAISYASLKDTQFARLNTQEDNEEHAVRNLVIYAFLRSCVFYLAILPFCTIGLPYLRYVLDHPLYAVLCSALLLLSYTGALSLSTLMLSMIILLPPLCALISYAPEAWDIYCGNQVLAPPLSHPTDWRTPDMTDDDNDFNEELVSRL